MVRNFSKKEWYKQCWRLIVGCSLSASLIVWGISLPSSVQHQACRVKDRPIWAEIKQPKPQSHQTQDTTSTSIVLPSPHPYRWSVPRLQVLTYVLALEKYRYWDEKPEFWRWLLSMLSRVWAESSQVLTAAG